MKDGDIGVQSINRALGLLEAFPKFGPEVGLSELARYTNLNKTTTYRILQTLEKNGYLSRSPINHSYRLGVRLFELGSYFQSKIDIYHFSKPYLKALSEETNQAAFLCVRNEDEAICIADDDVQHEYKYVTLRVGGKQPLHCGGASRALLLTMNDKEIAEYAIATGLPSMTPKTIKTIDALINDVKTTHKKGYVMSDEDLTVGIAAIGAPVRDYSGAVVAAISIGGIAQIFRMNEIEFSKEVKKAASCISTQMGFSGRNIND
jgi:DNA-binding IclR family transcriptional regulator